MTSQTGRHRTLRDVSRDEADKGSSDREQRPSDDFGARRSGRVAFDERGNSIWEWQTEDPDKFSRDVNTHYLKKLEAPDLALEEGDKGSIERPGSDVKQKSGTGFNPYERAVVPGESKAANQGAPEHGAPDQRDGARKPIKDLRRYNEWVKLKQRMAEKKKDDE